MSVERYRNIVLLMGLLTASCAGPKVRKDRLEIAAAPSPPTGDAGARPPESGSPSGSQPAPSPFTSLSEVVVSLKITPSRARLEIDGRVVPPRGNVARTVYLSRGVHEIKIEDEKGEFPPFSGTRTIDANNREFTFDLKDYLGELRVSSQPQIAFTLRIDGIKMDGPGPYRISPGVKAILFESPSLCYTPSSDVPKRVSISSGSTQTVEVKWVSPPEEIIRIQPRLREGREAFPTSEAKILFDGKAISSFDNGTAYKVPCGTARIEVMQAGYTQAVLQVHGVEWKRLKGQPWKPELVEEQMSDTHVDCHEVTVDEYDQFIAVKGPQFLPRAEETTSHNWHNRQKRLRHPVNAVSYENAKAYCEWRAREKGNASDGRVATVEDLRAVTGYASNGETYPWGAAPAPTCEQVMMRQYLGRDGCTDSPTKLGITAPVCARPRGNARFGHCDILGNVAEWVGPKRVFGGGFRDGFESGRFNMAVTPQPPRGNLPESDNVGFRCAWSLKPQEKCSCKESTIDHAEH